VRDPFIPGQTISAIDPNSYTADLDVWLQVGVGSLEALDANDSGDLYRRFSRRKFLPSRQAGRG